VKRAQARITRIIQGSRRQPSVRRDGRLPRGHTDRRGQSKLL